MPRIDVYSRQGCHLCELLLEELLGLIDAGGGRRAELAVHDVDTSADLQSRYGNDVPVVIVDGQELCRHRLDRDALRAILAGTE